MFYVFDLIREYLSKVPSQNITEEPLKQRYRFTRAEELARNNVPTRTQVKKRIHTR